jgi:YD repeat-containing protein
VNAFAERTTWAYDALGRATTITLANGTLTTATFDAAGRQEGIRHTAGGTELQRFAYSYDNSGRRTGVVEADGDGVTWTYDLTEPATRWKPTWHRLWRR